MSLASAYKGGSWRHKKWHAEITCRNPAPWCNKERGHCLLFLQLCCLNPLFQDSKSSIMTFLSSQDSRTLCFFFCFARKHLSKPCFPLLTLLLHLPLLGPVCQKRGCDIMWNKRWAHFVLNQWTEPWIDLVELASGIKLPLWSHNSCAYLPWSGQWIFSAWSPLKDVRWHLSLSPGAQTPLPQWSFTINHSKCLGTLNHAAFKSNVLCFLAIPALCRGNAEC